MIEEQVRVTGIDGDFATVTPASAGSGCDSCSASGGCGVSMMSRLLEQRQQAGFRVKNDIGAKPGDLAILGIPERTFLKGAALLYLSPLLGLFLFSMLARLWLAPDGEMPVIIAGALGFATGLGWLRMRNKRQGADNLPTLQRLVH